MTEKSLEQSKKEDYYAPLFTETDISAFLRKPLTTIRRTAAPLDIPDIGAAPAGGATPAVTPPPTGDPAMTPPPVGGATPPSSLDATTDTPPIAPPESLQEKKPFLDEEGKKEVGNELSDVTQRLENIENDLKDSILHDQIMQEVQQYCRKLEKELEDLKKRKIPDRDFYDLEGAYRETLYSIAVRVLDELLPDLFGDIPEYSFLSTHVSRTFEDGTVADAIVSVVASVIKNDMKHDFKVELPILNGLMQYPAYISHGKKIIPLTKNEVQNELDEISYKRVDVQKPYQGKENLFTKNNENIYRRPDKQKWYKVSPNEYKPVGLVPNHKLPPQQGRGN